MIDRADCRHERLGFASGGFYVQCADCGFQWTAGVAPEVDYSVRRDLSMHDLRLDPALVSARKDGAAK